MTSEKPTYEAVVTFVNGGHVVYDYVEKNVDGNGFSFDLANGGCVYINRRHVVSILTREKATRA